MAGIIASAHVVLACRYGTGTRRSSWDDDRFDQPDNHDFLSLGGSHSRGHGPFDDPWEQERLFDDSSDMGVNPATGLLMIGMHDTAGNLYGFSSASDSMFDDHCGIGSAFDSWDSSGCGSGFDDWHSSSGCGSGFDDWHSSSGGGSFGSDW
ncbi:MAG TPA: hypothetical protein PKZ76_13580 [Xanthomonadaceae bacterium]|nr:hypothetical protein [Xanthomonadaceae bacterium]